MAIDSFQNVSALPTNFPSILSTYQRTSTDLDTTLNTTLAQKYKGLVVPSPSGQGLTFATSLLREWGQMEPQLGTWMGNLTMEKVSAINTMVDSVQGISQGTGSLEGV